MNHWSRDTLSISIPVIIGFPFSSVTLSLSVVCVDIKNEHWAVECSKYYLNYSLLNNITLRLVENKTRPKKIILFSKTFFS